ncbi:MAG: radical SAM protein [Candidatus Diapherotrites archaeon]
MQYYWFQFKRSWKRFVFTPYFGIRKFLNAGLLFAQYLFFRPSKVIGYPLKLSFDPSSICMLKCPLCPTGQQKNGRTLGKMDFEKYKKIVDETAPYLYEIDLNNWGEPLLNENIAKMVEYAHKKRIKTSINTNLNVKLSEKQVGELINAGLDQLYVSMDGITQKTYEKYRKKGDLKTVMDNIKRFSKKKTELGVQNPFIVWQFLIMKHNEHELPELKRVKEELGVNKLVKGSLRSDMGDEIFIEDKIKVENTQDYLPRDEGNSRYDYKKKERKLKKEYCHLLWFVAVVNWNGSIAPCCSSYYEKFDFGNAFEQGFGKIWNNEMYQKARHAVAKKVPDSGTVCDNCLRTGFVD